MAKPESNSSTHNQTTRQQGTEKKSSHRLDAELRPGHLRPKRLRKSIKIDRIHPVDFNRYELRFFCEDCSHYSASNQTCTMGYRAQHTRAEQLANYKLMGGMAQCRFLEID